MILRRVGLSHRKGLHSGRKAARLSYFARGSPVTSHLIRRQNDPPQTVDSLLRLLLLAYALIGTAKLNDIDPQAWLADVLDRIADLPQTRLHELLPWHWKADRQQDLAA